MKVVFKKPYLTEQTDGSVRLCCDMHGLMQKAFTLWYEVDSEYAQGLWVLKNKLCKWI